MRESTPTKASQKQTSLPQKTYNFARMVYEGGVIFYQYVLICSIQQLSFSNEEPEWKINQVKVTNTHVQRRFVTVFPMLLTYHLTNIIHGV